MGYRSFVEGGVGGGASCWFVQIPLGLLWRRVEGELDIEGLVSGESGASNMIVELGKAIRTILESDIYSPSRASQTLVRDELGDETCSDLPGGGEKG